MQRNSDYEKLLDMYANFWAVQSVYNSLATKNLKDASGICSDRSFFEGGLFVAEHLMQCFKELFPEVAKESE